MAPTRKTYLLIERAKPLSREHPERSRLGCHSFEGEGLQRPIRKHRSEVKLKGTLEKENDVGRAFVSRRII